MVYDCIIIGGGIAGLQAAIQLGRYEHNILVIDAAGGRSSLCRDYHNLLGWPDGVSGDYFRKTGKQQAEKYGVEFLLEKATAVARNGELFSVRTEHDNTERTAKRLLFATGITENIPNLTGIKTCLGKTIYICPDCDGYEIKNQKTVIIGSGEKAIHLASTLLYWSNDLIIINQDKKPISDESRSLMTKKNVPIIEKKVVHLEIEQDSQLTGVKLEDGQFHRVTRAFLAMRGAYVNSDLAATLGVERLENKHVLVNPRTKETNIPNVWAVGDIVVHSQLLSIAMGDGAQAAVWIHKSLLH